MAPALISRIECTLNKSIVLFFILSEHTTLLQHLLTVVPTSHVQRCYNVYSTLDNVGETLYRRRMFTELWQTNATLFLLQLISKLCKNKYTASKLTLSSMSRVTEV